MVVKYYIVYNDINLEYIKLKNKIITTDQMISLNNHNIKIERFSYLTKTLEENSIFLYEKITAE